MSTSDQPSFRELVGLYAIERPVRAGGFERGDYIKIAREFPHKVFWVRELDLDPADIELMIRMGVIDLPPDVGVPSSPDHPRAPAKRKRRSPSKPRAKQVRRGGLRLA